MSLSAFFQSTLRSGNGTGPLPAGLPVPAWDYDPQNISIDALAWPSTGTRPEQALALSGSAVVERAGGPNGKACVAFVNNGFYDGTTIVDIAGNAPRTHLVVFRSASAGNVELMGWGTTTTAGELYDAMLYQGIFIQHFYGYEVYAAAPEPVNQWNAALVRGKPAGTNELTLDIWANNSHQEVLTNANTGNSGLRIGLGHYDSTPDERRIARVLIWDRDLNDSEIAQL